MIHLVAKYPNGRRGWALKSIFPAHETDADASTFPTREHAQQGALMATATGTRVLAYELFCAETGICLGVLEVPGLYPHLPKDSQ